MPNKYAVLINEKTYGLVVFLNDGVHPHLDKTKGDAYLVCEVNAPFKEITTTVAYESELYCEGLLHEPMTILVG